LGISIEIPPIIDISEETNKKKKNILRIKCDSCHCNVGHVLSNDGPNKSTIAAFGREKVTITGEVIKEKWKVTCKMEEFRNLIDIVTLNETPIIDTITLPELKFVSSDDLSNPEYRCQVLLKRNLRTVKPVQEQAYKIALITNAIVSLPTGFGKTMVFILIIII
jgi:hypothetical protein